ncbi:hypothetical protein PHSY_000148 [Pseudozyma hubeiensis SY62]|uniref:Uncharacterized protein n=1 Tax=Pseudozyma hubeiensis (strain SY62) TaxID=1305764 RepID=R9NVT6_PSEHS|nr:hypothetical protein PHSY_000148 [Pseudozyma hubeiensis SY62]GAC92594.1 hypothetical protein PHSY_000148 [Pseudozyma hubeiensis SY62]
MKFTPLALIAALLVAATSVNSQLVDDPSSSLLERSLDPSLLSSEVILEARQASSSNATTTSSAAEPSGSAALGGDATITEPSCSMTNHLSQNQQASWGNGFINTCCSFNQGVTCWYRRQDDVSPQQECEIPTCEELASDDRSKWVGFVPLNSTNGSGKWGNTFLSLGMLSPAAAMVPMMGAVVAVAMVVVTMVTV